MAEQPPFAQMLYRYLDRIEVVCLVGAAGSVLAVNAGMSAALQGVMIFLSGLAGVFFLNAYKPPVQTDGQGEKKDFTTLLSQTILPKILWISCSVGVIGLLFHLLQLEGSRQMLMIAAASTTLGVVSYILLSIGNAEKTRALLPVLYRAVPLMLITGYFLYGLA